VIKETLEKPTTFCPCVWVSYFFLMKEAKFVETSPKFDDGNYPVYG
jgi:hypothetical protein